MVSLIGRDNRSEGGEREVNTGERNQVGLELVQINVQRTIESERSGDGGNNLGNKTVQIREAWCSDTQSLLANVVKGFVINL